MIKISIRDSLKHDKDFNPKQELMKQVNWGDTANPKAAAFGNLLDLLELRQKVLIKYQGTDFYEKKRYENMLKRIQSKILVGFEKAIDAWIETHQEQIDTQTIDGQIQGLESLKDKYSNSSPIVRMDYKKAALFMAAQMIASSGGIDEKKFEDMFFKMGIGNNLYKENGSALSSKEIIKKIDVKKLIQLIINELTARKLTASTNMKIKDYISKAKSSGDIRDQIVTFEQALNAVHNSGPLMQYLIVDEYNRPLVDAPEPFVAFLDYLSNMSDKDLELTKADTEKLQSIAAMNYKHVIAFLGTQQQRDWGHHDTEWKMLDRNEWSGLIPLLAVFRTSNGKTPAAYFYVNQQTHSSNMCFINEDGNCLVRIDDASLHSEHVKILNKIDELLEDGKFKKLAAVPPVSTDHIIPYKDFYEL